MNLPPPSRPAPALNRLLAAGLLSLAATLAAACQSSSSTARRSALVGLGSAAGGLAGYQLGGRDATGAGVGAASGAMLTHLALGRDKDVLQDGFDQGYVQGQSDAIKRQYFLRHALESRPLQPSRAEGEFRTYLLPAPKPQEDAPSADASYLRVRVVE